MSEIFSNTSATGINATRSSQPRNVFDEESLNNVIAVQEENFEKYAGSPTWYEVKVISESLGIFY